MCVSKILNAIILGAPGGGKGTISKKLVTKYNFNHVSTGDLLRAHVQDTNSELGEVSKSSGKRLLLDGFPRTIPQAMALGQFLPLHAVVVLDIPHETIIDRISNRMIHPASGRIYNQTYNPEKVRGYDDETGEPLVQREDDKPQTVQARLEAYEAVTAPLIEYYTKQQKEAESSEETKTGNDDSDSGGVSVKVQVRRFAGTESDVIFPQVCDWLKAAKLV